MSPHLSQADWIVVCDFDGTITSKDIGNELHQSLKPNEFTQLQSDYRAGKISLKELQALMWNHFPMGQVQMKTEALKWSGLRPGCNDFFEYCAKLRIPVFIASCGIETYIESVIDHELSTLARSAIFAIESNRAQFKGETIEALSPPWSPADSPYPMDKGAWSMKMKDEHAPNARILAIGNGSSDRSFAGKVDKIAATDGFQKWCETNSVEHLSFDHFQEITQSKLLETK